MINMGRLCRFVLIGAGIAAFYAVLYLAFLRLSLGQVVANALAFGIAVTVQYAGQAHFTFRRDINNPSQMFRFGIMIAGGLFTSSLVTGLLAPYLRLPPSIAAVAVTLILPIQNLILMYLWVFPGQPPEEQLK